MPLARQQPRVRYVAIETRRQDEEHHAHLMALAAKSFARQPVSEFMEDFRQPQSHAQPQPVLRPEEFMERRKSCSKHREVGADQQQRTNSNEGDSHDGPLGEIPIREGGHRVEKFFRDRFL